MNLSTSSIIPLNVSPLLISTNTFEPLAVSNRFNGNFLNGYILQYFTYIIYIHLFILINALILFNESFIY